MATGTTSARQAIGVPRGMARFASALHAVVVRFSTFRTAPVATGQDTPEDGTTVSAPTGPAFCVDCGAPIYRVANRCRTCTPR